MKIELDTESNDPATQDALGAYVNVLGWMNRDKEAQDILIAMRPERYVASVFIQDAEGQHEQIGPFTQEALDILSSHLVEAEQNYCVVTE